MGRVKFYCDCGKELFVLMPEEMKRETTTIKDLERTATCSDCILEEAKKARRIKLWFCALDEPAETEGRLIRALQPPWNIQQPS